MRRYLATRLCSRYLQKTHRRGWGKAPRCIMLGAMKRLLPVTRRFFRLISGLGQTTDEHMPIRTHGTRRERVCIGLVVIAIPSNAMRKPALWIPDMQSLGTTRATVYVR